MLSSYHMKPAAGHASASVAEAAVGTVSDTLFLWNPRHSHPNSPKSQPLIYFLPGWSYETAYILSDYSHRIHVPLSSPMVEEQILK